MRVLVILLCLIAGGAAALSWINYQLAAADIGAINSVHYQQGVFENTQPIAAETGSKLADILYRSLTEERTAAAPVSPLPLTSLTRPQLDALPNKGVFYVKLHALFFPFHLSKFRLGKKIKVNVSVVLDSCNR